MVKFLSYSKKKGKLTQITTRCHSLSLVVSRCHSLYHSFSIVVTHCTTLCHSLSLDVPLVCLFINDRIFVMFVNEEVCQIVLIISSSTDYEFFAAIFIFKALMSLLLSWDACGSKDWWCMVSTPDKKIYIWLLDEKNYSWKLRLPVKVLSYFTN